MIGSVVGSGGPSHVLSPLDSHIIGLSRDLRLLPILSDSHELLLLMLQLMTKSPPELLLVTKVPLKTKLIHLRPRWSYLHRPLHLMACTPK